MPRKKLRAKGHPEISKWDRDKEDCHWLPYLEYWVGRRGTFITSKGTVCGILRYENGWFYCQAPEVLQDDGTWIHTNYRFLFRKGQFKSVESPRSEYQSILGLI